MGSKETKKTIDRQIEENLKRVYNEALEQDVPDRFRELIEKLKAGESGSNDN